jgi:hypothetical protein
MISQHSSDVPPPDANAMPASSAATEARMQVQMSASSWTAIGDLGKWVGKNAASGIVGSAAGMLFQEFLGAVGLGGPNLVAKLDEISNKITEVQRSLDRLTAMTAEVLQQFNELRIYMEKSLKIQDLFIAMGRIDVAYGRHGESLLHGTGGAHAISLRLLTETMPHLKDATPAYLKEQALAFATYVSDIPSAINTIRKNLMDANFGELSLLQHWTRELVQQILAKKISRESAYLVLEGYFLQAVSIQLKGLCVHGVALSTNELGPQLITRYLDDDFGKVMREQLGAYLTAVDDIIFRTLDPIMLTGLKKMDAREFPVEVDRILLRADLLCAVLKLIGKKTTGPLAPTPQAAIQGIYARSLFRPSDLNAGKAPSMELKGYQNAPADTQRQLPFCCLDLYAPAGRPMLTDVDKALVTMAHYQWAFPTPAPAPDTPIDVRYRGAAAPALYPVFGADEPMVLAAGIFNGDPLFCGMPSDASRDTPFTPFPSGNDHITYSDQKLSANRHALSNGSGTVFESSFQVQNASRAFATQQSQATHRLFGYAGKQVKLRMWAHVTTRMAGAPRRDQLNERFFSHQYKIFNRLRLRFPNGTEKEFYNSVEAYSRTFDVSAMNTSVNVGFDLALSGSFSIDFDLVPGDYHLVLKNEANFPPCGIPYDGWQSTTLDFKLKMVTLEMIFPEK